MAMTTGAVVEDRHGKDVVIKMGAVVEECHVRDVILKTVAVVEKRHEKNKAHSCENVTDPVTFFQKMSYRGYILFRIHFHSNFF